MKATVRNVLRGLGLRKRHLGAAWLCCERNVLATFKKPKSRDVGRILCYHSVGQTAWGVNDVSPRRFRQQIELALARGLEFVPASEIVKTGGRGTELAVTFDDGLKSVLTTAAPILKEYGIPWTAFVVSDWCEHTGGWERDVVLDWRDVEAVAAAGAEIGSHSVTHPDFSRLTQTEVEDELGRSRHVIRERTGIDAGTFAIPFGQSGNWPIEAGEAARAAGYSIIYAQAEETRPVGTVARTFVTSFDDPRIFSAALGGVFDRWEEWVP